MNNIESPRMDDAGIEAVLKANSPAPRVTLAGLDDVIASAYWHVPPGTTLTLCVLTLKNGFHVVGESACASPENFDPEIGRKLAHANAKNKIWPLEGYLLRQRLSEREQAAPASMLDNALRKYTRADFEAWSKADAFAAGYSEGRV